MSRFLIVLFLGLFSAFDSAADVRLEGQFSQGGLLVGKAEPGDLVELDGKRLPLSGDGRFLVGFGRDAAKKAVLKITGGDGKSEIKTIEITVREYQVQRIDGLPSRKVSPKPEDIARIKSDNAGIGRVRALETRRTYFMSGFMWPVTGPLSGLFGSQRILNGKPRNPHNGVDIAAPEGTVILAPADGRVALVNNDMFYTGETLMLDHGLGLSTVYAHMSVILVAQGTMVKKGTPIGRVGKTGRVTGAHLHWGATLGRTHLDPALLAGRMP